MQLRLQHCVSIANPILMESLVCNQLKFKFEILAGITVRKAILTRNCILSLKLYNLKRLKLDEEF